MMRGNDDDDDNDVVAASSEFSFLPTEVPWHIPMKFEMCEVASKQLSSRGFKFVASFWTSLLLFQNKFQITSRDVQLKDLGL